MNINSDNHAGLKTVLDNVIIPIYPLIKHIQISTTWNKDILIQYKIKPTSFVEYNFDYITMDLVLEYLKYIGYDFGDLYSWSIQWCWSKD